MAFLVEIYSHCGGYLLPVLQSCSPRDVDFLPVWWRLVAYVAETFGLCYRRLVTCVVAICCLSGRDFLPVQQSLVDSVAEVFGQCGGD